ncbi:hypothetical protein U1Q18_015851, partial [Sarracenia purpurea var. burkii]
MQGLAGVGPSETLSLVCTKIYRVPISHRVTVLKLTPFDVGKPLPSPVFVARIPLRAGDEQSPKSLVGTVIHRPCA